MPKMFARCAAAALLALTPPASGWAATLKIYPVLVALDDKTPVETMTIENSGDAPARMQVRVVAWRQDNGQDLFEETRDILANPPLFEIAPGGQQIARFGLRTAPAPTEKAIASSWRKSRPIARPPRARSAHCSVSASRSS
ncbi:molecular chaperone [Sphingobium scionense]